MLVFLMFWLLCIQQEGLAVLQDDVCVRHTKQADVTFTVGLLWTGNSSSITECAVTCMSDSRCVTFTISARASDGGFPFQGSRQCRGHSLTIGDLGVGVTSHGVRVYSLRERALATVQTTTQAAVESTTTTTATTTEAPWHKSSCVSNSNCPADDSECFAGRCLCTPGYYYSAGSNTCVDNCAQNLLQQELVEYPMYYILGYNTNSLTTSFASCRSLCLGDATCRSMDFRYSTNRCSTAIYTPRDVPGAWTQSTVSEQLYYYQRVCA